MITIRRAVIAAATLLACRAPERAEAPAVTVPAGTPLALAPAPRISVGVIEGDTAQQFNRVVTPFLLPDGSLVVPDGGGRGASVIRVFGPDGTFVRSLGRPGEGPGEFKALQQAWNRGDTIEAWDAQNQARITRFLPEGTIEVVRLDGPFSAQSVIGTFQNGWALHGVESAPPNERDRMRVHRFLRSGEYAGEIGWLEGMLRFNVPDVGGGPTPLSPKWLIASHDNQVYLGESLTPRVSVIDSIGDTLRVISWTPDPSPAVEDVLAAVIDSAVASVPYEGYNAYLQGTALGVRGYFEAAPVPARVSVAWGLVVDSEGFVWIRPYEPLRHSAALGGLKSSGLGGTWIILSPAGDRVGTVTIPDDLEPIQITRDAVVGIRKDELGVQYVRVYALERR